ncbi:hypothetical protein [Oleispirillum naphthae]|uniref:hypothetical protein n=1 Tax=Oleispirillum naphthae TaxID=2838853 RepID=UPI0030823975
MILSVCAVLAASLLLGFGMAVRYFPGRRSMPASPDVARLLGEIRARRLFGPAGCDDPGIRELAASYGFRVVDRDGTILKLRRNAWVKFKSLSAGGRLLGVLIFPLSLSFAAGLLAGLAWRRGFDELIHLDPVVR